MFPIRDDTPRFSTPYITYFIIALNVVVFLFELSVGAQSPRALNGLMYQFGVVPLHFERALAGTSHTSLPALSLTILTSMFLHASWLHIIGNMWFLWIFGDNIEDYLGHFSYLAVLSASADLRPWSPTFSSTRGSNVPAVGSERSDRGSDGRLLRAVSQGPRHDVVSAHLFLPPSRLAGAGILVLDPVPERRRDLDCGIGRNAAGLPCGPMSADFVAGIVLIKLMPERQGRSRYAAW